MGGGRHDFGHVRHEEVGQGLRDRYDQQPASQKARLTCLPTGTGNLSFGLGIGCSAGWYGYTGGITGYNTGAYYMPATGITSIVFVNTQVERPFPGVANAIFRGIAKIITPNNVPFVK